MYSPYQYFFVSDTETGGLISAKKKAFDGIALTEVAIVVVDQDLNEVEEHCWLIKPYKDDLIFEPGAQKVSGISRKMCEKEGQDVEKVMKEIIALAKKYTSNKKKPIFVGQNFRRFDLPFFENMFIFFKKKFTTYFSPDVLDTMDFGRLYKPEAVGYSLGENCKSAGFTFEDAHRALPDTKATSRLWIHYMKNLRGLNSGAGKKVKKVKKYRKKFQM